MDDPGGSNASGGQLINFPAGSDVTDRPVEIPDLDRIYPQSPAAPPESPAETTMELPPIRGPISPETALRETGMPAAPDSDDGEYEEGEYVQPRSLADRLGDWLELRIEMARDRHASEAPFREAEIARKAALLEARTAQETAMMEQNGKLHTALMKAKSDKAAARGKADAARSSSSGMGADKGGRSKAGGGGGSRGGGDYSGGSGRGGTGGGRGSGPNGSGGTGRGSGGGNSPKGAGKGSDRAAGGRGGASKGNESSGGSKGRQNGSGGPGSGKGSSGGSGKNGSGGSGSGKGGSKGDGGKTHNSPSASPRAERARGRQERAAARQAARQERRGAKQAAGLADRSKDRDQKRGNRQAEREERRAAKAERKAARKAKRDAAKAAEDRTTLGEAVAEEAQRRWDKRRAAEKDEAAKDGKAKDSTGDKDSEATTKKMPKGGPETSSDGSKDDSATKEPDDGKKSGEKPSGGFGDKDTKDGTGTDDGAKPDDVKDPPDSDDGRSFKEKFRDFFTKAGEDATPPEPEEPSRLRPEDFKVTVGRPGGPTRATKTEAAEEDIVDAVVVEDAADPFGATVSSPASLPRAPEPHTQRPGTTRPTAQEDPVASEVSRPTSGQAGMAAKHRTDITFDQYLMDITNIALSAEYDRTRAQDLAVALGKVADALRDMAADLVGDHNIATEVVDQITNLADAAMLMKQMAERCATECEMAYEAARLVAVAVGRTYGEDIQAMDDAGLAHASAAAHHD
ncbi:ATP/GTP-binding protein [Streptomyces sp. MC1]|uniref:ATP/GTP-binding protein n=1 Tax=Streptomyces sp. MC1 TaxID=295105 RepID=UPI0027DDC3DC|nr:ATP/GTP-binding protein [Streptomyces sp. MC1]